ncbi:MAG: hypothetical protein MSQ05_01080 [Akkermansia sp.]|nr:hypothetical protein [Akkermansia sp.]
MKLHLPKALRTALLACILAVSPAYAETLTTELATNLLFFNNNNGKTGQNSSDVTTTNTSITFDPFSDRTSSATSWYLDLQFTTFGQSGPSYSAAKSGDSAAGLSAYLDNDSGTICIGKGNIKMSAEIPLVVGNTYRLAFDAYNNQIYLLDRTSVTKDRILLSGTEFAKTSTDLKSGTSWYWSSSNGNHATLKEAAKIGTGLTSWVTLDFQKAIGYNPFLDQPVFGGPVYTYSTVDNVFLDGHSAPSVPARTGDDSMGPVLIFENVGEVTVTNTVSTSESGGIQVTGNSQVTCSLGGAGGAIYVGEGAELTTTYS